MAERPHVFPFVPLDPQMSQEIEAMCGGMPPFLDGFRQFLAHDGMDGLSDILYRQFLADMGRYCLGAIDVTVPGTSTDFNRGALLYAGTVAKAGGLRPLPHSKGVLSDVEERQEIILALEAAQAVDSMPSFNSLLSRFRDLFSNRSGYDGLVAARLGAGLVHIITVDSILHPDGGPIITAKGDEDDTVVGRVAELELRTLNEGPNDADFAELKNLFDNAEWPD